jgi:hypothetical protein
MDITTGFEPVIGGSSPSESTSAQVNFCVIVFLLPRGYRLVVGRVLAKDEVGVRFSLSAPKER